VGRFLRVGLSGGLATGKSTVLAVFAALGARVLDADQLAREVLAPGTPGHLEAAEIFGAEVLAGDGSIDRAKLAAKVFADPEARRRLEAMVHPEVLRREQEWREQVEASAESGVLVVDATLILELGRSRAYDLLVVTVCPEEEQVRRAVLRGMSAADARARLAAQMPGAEKASRADLVIDTSGSLAQTQARAREVYRELERRRAALNTT